MGYGLLRTYGLWVTIFRLLEERGGVPPIFGCHKQWRTIQNFETSTVEAHLTHTYHNP